MLGAEVTRSRYQEIGQNLEKEPDIGDPTAQPGTSSSQQESPDIDDPTAQPGTSSQQESPDIDDPTAQPWTSSYLQESTSNSIEASLKNTTTIPSNTLVLFKSPEEVRPYPKALPRQKKGGREHGWTRILTDTPEK
ncbi:hypothetical protein JTB14_028243 [Gonioctena quinquepunctata]|nr:hypothetical protein JTB14_028243 [Gonioctena quinquepunctata]